MREQHLIIDWSNAFSEDDMVKQIENVGLQHIETIDVAKFKNKSKTLTKFYSVGYKVDDERGSTDFKIYLVTSPFCYDYRLTSKGNRLVNTILFDLKKKLRKQVKSKIHATDNIQETKDNLKVLGLYKKHYKRREFENISQVFDTLNELKDFKYVIMRNFEGIPDEITIDEHLDVDLLVTDYYLIKNVLDATTVSRPQKKLEDGGYRILNSVLIEGKEVWFDFRHFGDKYYDTELERRLLDSRVPHKNFYIPDTETHRYTLIYHAVIHKRRISKTYKKIFRKLGLPETKTELLPILNEYMDRNNFEYTKPHDESVGFWV